MSLQELIIKSQIKSILKSIDDVNENAKLLGINTFVIINTINSKLDDMHNDVNTIDVKEITEYLLSKFKKKGTNLGNKRLYIINKYIIKIEEDIYDLYAEQHPISYFDLYCKLFRCMPSTHRANEYHINSIKLNVYKDEEAVVFHFSDIEFDDRYFY